MKVLTLRQKLYLSFVVVALLLLTTGYLYNRSSNQYVGALIRVEQTQNVLRQLETVLSLAKDAETGQRGFVITGQENFLEPYHLAQQRLLPELNQLEQLAAGDAFHAPRLRQVRRLVEAEMRFLARSIEQERAGRQNRAAERAVAAEGKRLLDAIRLLVAEMQAHERRLLDERLTQTETQARTNNAVNLLGLGVLVGLFALAVTIITRDLVRQRHLEEQLTIKNDELAALNANQRNLLDRLYEAQQIAQVGSFDLDLAAHTFIGTPELYRIYGWDPAVAGQPTDEALFGQFIHPEDQERVAREVAASIASPGPYASQYRIVLPDGAVKHLLVRGRPVQEPDAVHFQGTVMDVTERQLAEQQLQQLNLNLQRTNDELSTALEDLSTASRQVQLYSRVLEQQNEELEAFSYSVSHDLKTPLRSVLAYGGILEEEYGTVLDEEGRRLLGIVLSSARAMHELIEALLQLARLGRTAVRPEQVDMDRLVSELLAQLMQEADNPPDVALGPLGVAYADRQLIRQVWYNLLGNAVKFSAREATPRITVSTQTGAAETVYCIRDNGVGFDPRYAGELFGVFKRLHSADGFAGTGVGLAICQRIVANHGGRIWAEGAEGSGATFCFALPNYVPAA